MAQSTPSCSFNFVPDRPTGSWPANQTPRINVTRKHTRSHGQAWLVTLLASGKVEVVEREDLERIMRERQPGRLSEASGAPTGVVMNSETKTNSVSTSIQPEYRDYSSEFQDPVALGKLLRADVVVLGKVTARYWCGAAKSAVGYAPN